MSEKFWIKLWLGTCISCVLMVVSLSTCTMHTNTKIGKAIETGANPIDVKIAFSACTDTRWIAVRELGKATNNKK